MLICLVENQEECKFQISQKSANTHPKRIHHLLRRQGVVLLSDSAPGHGYRRNCGNQPHRLFCWSAKHSPVQNSISKPLTTVATIAQSSGPQVFLRALIQKRRSMLMTANGNGISTAAAISFEVAEPIFA